MGISFYSLFPLWASIFFLRVTIGVFPVFKTHLKLKYFFKLLASFCLNEVSLLDIVFPALCTWLCFGSERTGYFCFSV